MININFFLLSYGSIHNLYIVILVRTLLLVFLRRLATNHELFTSIVSAETPQPYTQPVTSLTDIVIIMIC